MDSFHLKASDNCCGEEANLSHTFSSLSGNEEGTDTSRTASARSATGENRGKLVESERECVVGDQVIQLT